MKLFVSAFAIALFFAPVALMGLSSDTAKQTFESATQALHAGDYPAAEAGFNKVLRLDPRNVSALANLGVLYAKTHRYGKAIEAYQRVLEISPQLREIQLDLGLAYLKQEDYERALPYFRQLHERSPDDHQATMLLATCLTFQWTCRSRSRPAEAVDRSGESDSAALYLLGVAYARAGQAQAAQEVFTRLFADSATPAQANFLLGHAYLTTEPNFAKPSRPIRPCCRPTRHLPGLIANWARYTSACRRTSTRKSN